MSIRCRKREALRSLDAATLRNSLTHLRSFFAWNLEIPTIADDLDNSTYFLRWDGRTMALRGENPQRLTTRPSPLPPQSPKASRRQTPPGLHHTMDLTMPGPIPKAPIINSRLSPLGSFLSWRSFPSPNRLL